MAACPRRVKRALGAIPTQKPFPKPIQRLAFAIQAAKGARPERLHHHPRCRRRPRAFPEEYDKVLHALGREPNLVELGIFSVMWSEHCSYKSSRIHLKKLPTKPPG
jgi:hypothetical protein